MLQIVLIFIAATLGLTYGHYSDGLIFSSAICLFAGVTMIMPTLFNVQLRDIRLVFVHYKLIIKLLALNFILLPALAVAIGLMTHNFGIAAGLFALSVFSGGGMVMHWIKKSHADVSLGFIILFINILLVTLSLLMLHTFGVMSEHYFEVFYSDEVNLSNFAKGVIELLIIAPFILAQIIKYLVPAVAKTITKYRVYLSNTSIFLIVFYLFALQTSQLIFEVMEFEPEVLLYSFIALLLFYLGSFLLAKWFFALDDAADKSAFYFTITRYITLALIISTFSIGSFGVEMLMPIMLAYLIQIPMTILLDKRYRTDVADATR